MNKQILVIGAHPDDEIIGLGGTLAKHLAQGDKVVSIIFTDGHGARIEGEITPNDLLIIENRKKAAEIASSTLGAKAVHIGDFADQMLDTYPMLQLVKFIEKFLNIYNPDIVYTHHFGDANYDHQMVFKASVAALRPNPNANLKAIYCYPTASSTEWGAPFQNNAFVPNHFVNITDFWPTKERALIAYQAEMRNYPHPRSIQGIKEASQYWGKLTQVPLAEAFSVFRQIL